MRNYWEARSKSYDRLNWVHDDNYIAKILSSVEFDKWDSVLDVGTGTGIMAKAVSPFVYIVIGLDNSREMLENAGHGKNILYVEGDVTDIKIPDNSFDKVMARSVFHHLGLEAQEAMCECYRVLKLGGKMVLAQGIPPSEEILNEYTVMMRLKDGRMVQTRDNLIVLMENAGFSNIRVSDYILRNFSLRNWLENNALSKDTQEQIFAMHVNGSEKFKAAYNLIIVNGDCFIDIKNAIIVGEK